MRAYALKEAVVGGFPIDSSQFAFNAKWGPTGAE
jgi:hypothetical protein